MVPPGMLAHGDVRSGGHGEEQGKKGGSAPAALAPLRGPSRTGARGAIVPDAAEPGSIRPPGVNPL